MRGEDAGRLRISDSDRDQISAVLGQHAAEGRLTMDELDHRLSVLFGAQTRAQASALLADLPELAVRSSPHHRGPQRDDQALPLPEWLGSALRGDSKLPEQISIPTAAGLSTATPMPAHENRAAVRQRAKLRQDENAIGHTFQATRRVLNAQLESSRVSGAAEEVERLEARLREAHETAEAARLAVAAGDRAQAQRCLARLRALR